MSKPKKFVRWRETSRALTIIRKADTEAKNSFGVGGAVKNPGSRRKPVTLPRLKFLEDRHD